MTNSPLVEYTKISGSKNSPRKAPIDFISPHIVGAQCTIESLGARFANPVYECSSNYGIDKNGRIGLFVPECDRSWCSSSAWNDHRAVTIECASDYQPPYRVNDIVLERLIELCTDICKRNDKNRLLWISDKERALAYPLKKGEMLLTVHCWYAAKACPGEYMLGKMSHIAQAVTGLLQTVEPPASQVPYQVVVDCIGLRIRKGAGTNTACVGECKPGIYTIVEEKTGHGSRTGWGRLKSGAGWISLDYTEKR